MPALATVTLGHVSDITYTAISCKKKKSNTKIITKIETRKAVY
jgi:hypothetical protein